MTVALGAVLSLGLALAACSSGTTNAGDDASSTNTRAANSPQYGDCTLVSGPSGMIDLDTSVPDTLTVATNLPVPGQFNGTDPNAIKGGLEYCLAAEFAHLAGIKHLKIKNVAFDGMIAGQFKDFDLAMNLIFITAERAKNVDFSQPYWDQPVGVATLKGRPLTKSQLHDSTIGVLAANLEEEWVRDTFKPTRKYKVYPQLDALLAGLQANQVDAAVYDLPTLLQAQKKTDGAIQVVGRLTIGGDAGVVFPKGSDNVEAINKAISYAKEKGLIEKMYQKWMVPSMAVSPSDIPEWDYAS